MPRIPNIAGPYRLHFYSADCDEPLHIHVERDQQKCKFWLNPTHLAYNLGFSPAELRRILDVILENQPAIMEAWREYCP